MVEKKEGGGYVQRKEGVKKNKEYQKTGHNGKRGRLIKGRGKGEKRLKKGEVEGESENGKKRGMKRRKGERNGER